MASFDENGKYIKTDWKAGDKITSTKLNKIEESIEAVNDNDISRHVEADARLDALEAKDVAHDKELTKIKNDIADNKAAAELGDYDINSRMTFLEEELNEGIEEVHNVADTVDGKIAKAESDMTNAVNTAKEDMRIQVGNAMNVMDTAKDEMNTQVVNAMNVMNTAKNEMTTQVNMAKDEMNTQVNNAKTEMTTQVNKAKSSMTTQVTTAKNEMTAQVNTATANMTAQVTTAKNEMTTQVNAAQASMTDQVITAKNDMEAMIEGGLTELEEKTFNLSLGIHTDGLIYMFYDGIPQGTGIAMASGEAGDIIGNLDSENNIILMGYLPNGTYMLKYENTDGTYIDVGELEVGQVIPPGPAYTNLAVYNATNTTDFSIWCNDSRVGSDGAYRQLAGYITTNFIEVSNNDIIRIEGLIKEASYPTMALYKSDKTPIRPPYYLSNVADNHFIGELTETDTGAKFKMITPDCKYIRFSGKPVNGGENIIITKNEEIV